ncbi:cupin domain-containing protein [Limnobacter sp.]|uniref:cupin domain-containing protein n=1 Tax=Limnobacter sp. TaxID=2003368 RepID=UPI00258DA8F6|nr:cupin domain-containing protein [Limnobacter sp.]
MQLNQDYSQRVVIEADAVPWVPSPSAGVHRKMLERKGEELAKATSIVRYDPGCEFPLHQHPGGEEIVVLEGVFEDEHAQYPAGSYLKNPVGSAHAPRSAGGCLIFVKLMYMQPDDSLQVVRSLNDDLWHPGHSSGSSVMVLSAFKDEYSVFVRLDPHAGFTFNARPNGKEVLVLEGSYSDDCGEYTQYTWIRSPRNQSQIKAGPQGCILFFKTGHF